MVPCVPSGAGPDAPDKDGIDADCDGIDGVVADSVFVDGVGGNDTNAGTMGAPVASIGRALSLAAMQQKKAVIVTAGEYSESISLVDGISVHGGYARRTFVRAPLVANGSTIVRATSSPVLTGIAITSPTRITGLTVIAPDASPGASSIAVRLVDASGLVIEDASLRAQAGGTGIAGSAPGSTSTVGARGINGIGSRCNSNDPNAGCDGLLYTVTPTTPTASPCTCGEGGFGSWAWGSPSSEPTAAGGRRLIGGACSSATAGNPGAPGTGTATYGNAGTDGAIGSAGGHGAAGVRGSFAESGVVAVAGGTGSPGGSGGGGGGGANGRAIDCFDAESTTLRGATGAHGGSGGCGGGGGGGGTSGGASVALFLWRSSPTLIRVTLTSGAGGTGGAGHEGAPGAMGGMGGLAIAPTHRCPNNNALANAGGNGGRGGEGGRGGYGGGGGGGISAAVVLGDASSFADDSRSVFASVGAPGMGGRGAPGGDGTPGAGGTNGQPGLACVAFHAVTSQCVTTLP